MSDDMPDSPMTALAENAASLHEVYTAYMEAGFPEQRAYDLTRVWLTNFLES